MTKRKSASQKRKELLEQRKGEDLRNLTIAERLTRRAQRKTTSITLQDNEDQIVIEIFQPTRKELDELLKCQVDIQKEETQAEAYEFLYNMLADLCVDDSLDYDFWKEGDYGLIDVMEIMNALFGDVLTRYQEIQMAQSFRKDGHGSGSLPAMRVPEEVPP